MIAVKGIVRKPEGKINLKSSPNP